MKCHDPKDHTLTIDPDGSWLCSCGQWNDKLLGRIGSDYMLRHGVTEEVIRRWHRSHAKAWVINLEDSSYAGLQS